MQEKIFNSYIRIEYILEVIKFFIILEMNSEKDYNYLNNEIMISLSKQVINKVYKEIRNVIHNYNRIVYETEKLGDLNSNHYFSIDESLFGHRNNKKIWILGTIENEGKDFRLEASYERN